MLAVVLVAGGCGKSAPSSTASSHSHPEVARGAGVSAAAVNVIAGWADALRDNQPRRAAAYLAHPSAMVNGTDSAGRLTVIHIDSEHDALIADETLSCGATLLKTSRRGAYVRADFTLSIRTGPGASTSGCSGPASVDFLIRSAHIVRWLRAPVGSDTPETAGPESSAPESATPESGKEPGVGETPGAQSS
jgi:hypothetical protein